MGVLLCRHRTESRNDSVPHNAIILGGIIMLYRGTANNNSSVLSAKSRFLPIPVRTENIVPVFAMGSTERKWHMEKEHYHKIITYQTTVSILKSWMPVLPATCRMLLKCPICRPFYKSHGPMQQPISPHIAKTLNITASPLGNARLPAERVPGQKRLTVKPQSAQAESASIGLFENAAT